MKEIVAITLYGYVNGKRSSAHADCSNVYTGESFSVSGISLNDKLLSSDRYTTEEKVSMTRLAELLVTAGDAPFSVAFFKKDGSERLLRGKLIAPEPLMGRSMVEDFDAPAGKARLRQVDHRTIQSIIIRGVRYHL